MSTNPPNRPGIVFAVGARLEAQDYLQKWYTSRIEKIDYEQGKMLIHFERWSHRYNEWIYWDSHRLRPLEGHPVRKEALEEEEITVFKAGDEVLARWTDCRYYPAKIEDINEEGTHTVQFYDGVIRSLKRIHIKSMPEDAKGQDWLALVKAATAAAAAAAKNKPVVKHRVKDKEERKLGRGAHFKKDRRMLGAKVKEDEAQKKQEEPVSVAISAGNSEPLTFEPKQTSEQAETTGARKRKASVICSFQAKRARLNKITGLLASKAVSGDGCELLEERTGGHPVPDQLQPPDSIAQLKTEGSSGDSYRLNQKSDPLSSSSSVTKLRRRKTKAEEAPWSTLATNHPPDPPIPQGKEFHNVQFPQTLSPPPPPDIPHTGSVVSWLPPRQPGVLGISDLMPLDLSQNSRLRIPAPHLAENQAATKPRPKAVTRTASGYSAVTKNRRMVEDPSSPKGSPTAMVQDKLRCTFPSCCKMLTKDIHRKCCHRSERGLEPKTGASESRLHTFATAVDTPRSAVDTPESRKGRPAAGPVSPPPCQVGAVQQKPVGESPNSTKVSRRKRSSVSFISEPADTRLAPSVKERSAETVREKIVRECVDRDRNAEVGKRESKERKDPELIQLTQKTKKSKKNISKHELPPGKQLRDVSVECLERCASPVTKAGSSLSLRCGTVTQAAYVTPKSRLASRSLLDISAEHVQRCDSVSDDEFYDGSSTESALMSEDSGPDDEDSTDQSEDEDDDSNAVVRCVCEMDEENGFMIQCEECLCWQHGVCLGLLEDNVPDQYVCYICRDPPGESWSAKYCYDKDWLRNGHLYGLSFLSENYSQQNAKKIVSTHQLLADVYSMADVLHGLQMKINILQSRKHPDLQLWAQPCIKSTREAGVGGQVRAWRDGHGTVLADKVCHGQSGRWRGRREAATYINTEHSYQKPPTCSRQRRLWADGCSSDEEDGTCPPEEQRVQGADNLPEQQGVSVVGSDSSCERRLDDGHSDAQCPRQMNLLTHIEAIQNEVNTRMDVIEKELDVLERWLDFSGGRDVPEPLARLPQLKSHIKQLLADLGKVQEMACCCPH
ncbi:PHD finger protein 20-like protein 1 isoform X4 [Leucoraja erinacea]|uniref:PHD finger protein 20-like protein 1 isoform X4 n=1 Tax=Leucoraja erinaceus TaxID=7782 RepID=UPI002456E9D9|nr:PHD finger protein 20-like protein 1 isoform X4 [Leucoraja erinacea]